MSGSPAWVRVLTTTDGFEAKLLGVRLGAEGFLVEVRGATDGTYPFGTVHLYVPATEADEVRALLGALRGDAEATETRPEGTRRQIPVTRRVLVAVVAIVMLLTALGRVLLER
jgi:hypothetical protein